MRRGPHSLDELLTPSLQTHRGDSVPRERPWSVGSQVWVAFFGGILAVTVVAYLNGRRLGLSSSRQRAILLCGLASFLLLCALAYALSTWLGVADPQAIRLSGRGIALLTFLAAAAVQKSAARTYHFYNGEETASLWGAGLAATVGLGLFQGVLLGIALAFLTPGVFR